VAAGVVVNEEQQSHNAQVLDANWMRAFPGAVAHRVIGAGMGERVKWPESQGETSKQQNNFV